jgi:tetratricopeptide (TPR) repeat protein
VPTRPQAHQIDSRGDVLFRGAMPPKWAIRRQRENDYGIDYEVELFDDSDRSTGQLFKVQLKSSARFERDNVELDVRLRDLDYWNSLPVPILVVLADVTGGYLWCRWSVDMDPYPRRRDQAIKTFKFGNADRLTTDKLSEIESRVTAWRAWRHHEVGFPVGVVVVDESNHESVSEHTRASLRRSLADVELLDLRAHPLADLGIEVRLRPHETRFTTPGGPDVVVDAPLAVWWSGADGDLTALLALALAKAGWTQEAISLLRSPHEMTLLGHPLFAYEVVGLLLDGGAYDDALSALEGIVEHGPDAAAESALAVAFSRATGLRFDLERLRRAATRRFELRYAAADLSGASKAAYNLANHLRATSEWRDALEWYERAVESDSAYAERGYWPVRAWRIRSRR